jgi:RND family efflux transporter MFP subunit
MNMESLRAEVKLAEKRLNDTVLRAPFDGAVTQKHVSAGQYVKDNTPIVTLVKTWPLRLRADLPESGAGTVRPGASLVFTTDAAPGIEFHATVRELNPSLDARNRTLTVEARLAENDNRLRPGMFVQVRLIQDRASAVVMVPKAAVYSIAGLTKVFVVRDDKASEHKIPPGRELDGWMEVPSDQIRAGDQVATNNTAVLTDGAEVRVSR